MRSTEFRRAALVLVITLAGCASPPPPTIAINRPQPAAADPRARLGALDTQAEESAVASVRGINYDELLSCTKRKLALQTLDQQLKNGVGALHAQTKSVDELGAAIETGRSKLNLTSQSAIDDFNKKVNAHHEKVTHPQAIR